MKNEQGNSAVIAVIVVAVIALVAFVAYQQGLLGGSKDDGSGIDVNLPGGNNGGGSGY